MVVSGFFRNFAEHLRKMHAQTDPPEACEASTNVAKGTDRTAYGAQPEASEVATAKPTGCTANAPGANTPLTLKSNTQTQPCLATLS